MIPIRHGASGTILNPWFEYPMTTTIWSFDRGPEVTAPTISPWSVTTFPEYGVELIAGPQELIFVGENDHQTAARIANLIEGYVSYQTLIAYNLIGAADVPDPRPRTVDAVPFMRLRMPLEDVNGHIIYRGNEEDIVAISADEIRNFVRVFDQPLAQALQHYLNVTDVRYILMEYYKAFEVIAEALGGTMAARKQLAPFGITKAEQSAFSALCNDQSHAPSEWGRHAALPGVSVYRVDPKYAFEDSRFMHDFDAAASFCRKMIDAYIAYRTSTS